MSYTFRSPIPKPDYQYRRPLFNSDLYALGAFPDPLRAEPDCDLPRGLSSFQGFANRCAAEAVSNVAEVAAAKYGARLFPYIPPAEIYKLAREIDDQPDFAVGTYLEAAAEAYCRIAQTRVQWMPLPLSADVFARMMQVERLAVAFGMVWRQQDSTPGPSRVLEYAPSAGGGHAVCLHGYKALHAWRRYWIFGKRREASVFRVENSNTQFPELEFYLPFPRVAADGIAALVLLPPGWSDPAR